MDLDLECSEVWNELLLFRSYLKVVVVLSLLAVLMGLVLEKFVFCFAMFAGVTHLFSKLEKQ